MVLDKLSLKLNNLYGPTEASIDVSFYDCVGLAKKVIWLVFQLEDQLQ